MIAFACGLLLGSLLCTVAALVPVKKPFMRYSKISAGEAGEIGRKYVYNNTSTPYGAHLISIHEGIGNYVVKVTAGVNGYHPDICYEVHVSTTNKVTEFKKL